MKDSFKTMVKKIKYFQFSFLIKAYIKAITNAMAAAAFIVFLIEHGFWVTNVRGVSYQDYWTLVFHMIYLEIIIWCTICIKEIEGFNQIKYINDTCDMFQMELIILAFSVIGTIFTNILSRLIL